MKSVDSLIQELNLLPKGYISNKRIKNIVYHYVQFIENGKIKSKYIKESTLDSIKQQISKREEIKKQIMAMATKSRVVVSKRSSELTGYLMMGDMKVASFFNGKLLWLDEEKAPFYIKKTGNIEGYIKSRTIDLTRPNARVLLKAIGIKKTNDLIALYSHAANISDNYWFKPKGSRLKYKDVSFKNDIYSGLALKGEVLPLKNLGSHTPELTSIGSFEKCWKIIENKWWLYKAGSEDNIFSELFSYEFAKLMGVPTAVYEYDEGHVRSKNFANKYNFEPAFSLCGDNEDLDFVFSSFYQIDKKIAKDFIKLVAFDCVIYNVDRHNQNYGLMRSKKTGKVISLAPNFDNNLALLSYNKTLDQSPKSDGLIKLFRSFISNNEIAKNLFKEISLPGIKRDKILAIFKNIPIKRDENKIADFVKARYDFIRDFKAKQ